MSKPGICKRCGHRCHKNKNCFKCDTEASMAERTASGSIQSCGACACPDCLPNIAIVSGSTMNIRTGQYK